MNDRNRSTKRDPCRLSEGAVKRLRAALGRNAAAFVRALQADFDFAHAATGPSFAPLRLPGIAVRHVDGATLRAAVRGNLDELLTAVGDLGAILRRLTRPQREDGGPDDWTTLELFESTLALGLRSARVDGELRLVLAHLDRLDAIARHARGRLAKPGTKRDGGKRALLAAVARAYRTATGTLPDAPTFGKLAAIVFADRERPDSSPQLRAAALRAFQN